MSENLDMLITKGVNYRLPKRDAAKRAWGAIISLTSRTKNNTIAMPDYIVRTILEQVEGKAHDMYLQGLEIHPNIARAALTVSSLYNLIHKTEVDESRNFSDRKSSDGTIHSMSFAKNSYGKELSISSGDIALTATASNKRDLLIESLYGDGRAYTIVSGCGTDDMQITGEELIATPTIRVSTPAYRYNGIVPPQSNHQRKGCSNEQFNKNIKRLLFDACAIHLLFSEPDKYNMINPIKTSTSVPKSQYQAKPNQT